jgi:hypothetical protein
MCNVYLHKGPKTKRFSHEAGPGRLRVFPKQSAEYEVNQRAPTCRFQV